MALCNSDDLSLVRNAFVLQRTHTLSRSNSYVCLPTGTALHHCRLRNEDDLELLIAQVWSQWSVLVVTFYVCPLTVQMTVSVGQYYLIIK